MAEGSHSVQITVAIIGVTGAIATAVIANWDKIFADDPPPAAVAAQPANAAAPVPVQAAPADAAAKLSQSQQRGMEANAAALDQVAAQVEGASAPRIAGTWHDDLGVEYRLVQDGARYSFTGHAGDIEIGRGEGQIEGRTMRHSYETLDDAGQCTGQIARGERLAFGTCTNALAQQGPFRITR